MNDHQSIELPLTPLRFPLLLLLLLLLLLHLLLLLTVDRVALDATDEIVHRALEEVVALALLVMMPEKGVADYGVRIHEQSSHQCPLRSRRASLHREYYAYAEGCDCERGQKTEIKKGIKRHMITCVWQDVRHQRWWSTSAAV